MVAYEVEEKVKGSNEVWQRGGTWILGNINNELLTKVDIISDNYGESFYGIVQYEGEEPKELKARLDKDNMYRVYVKDKKSLWKSDGIWVIGNRNSDRCNKIDISIDDGENLFGIIRYGNAEFDFKTQRNISYLVENHWGKDSAPWHFGGIWAFSKKNISFMDIDSEDSGESFSGNMQYEGEDLVCFKAKRIIGNNYEVYKKSICGTEAWCRCEDMIIGGRDNQRVVKLRFNAGDDGRGIYGTMAYEKEGVIGFRASQVKK